jgi:hypothetical protein
MKNSYGMSSLPANVIVDTTPEPSENFDHAEHIPEPIHKEIDSEAPRRSKRPTNAKSFDDDFTVYLLDDTSKTIIEAFASPDVDDWKEAVRSEIVLLICTRQALWPRVIPKRKAKISLIHIHLSLD